VISSGDVFAFPCTRCYITRNEQAFNCDEISALTHFNACMEIKHGIAINVNVRDNDGWRRLAAAVRSYSLLDLTGGSPCSGEVEPSGGQ
jgi:hypothetical protein